MGFRNNHVLIHHQTERFAEGMPTDLAVRLAAKQAMFKHPERERGEGWWKRPGAAGHHAKHEAGTDPFSWIKTHPLLAPAEFARFPFDHAGQGETSVMLALRPETVNMAEVGDGPQYTLSAVQASAELGEPGVALVLEHLWRTLAPPRPDRSRPTAPAQTSGTAPSRLTASDRA